MLIDALKHFRWNEGPFGPPTSAREYPPSLLEFWHSLSNL